MRFALRRRIEGLTPDQIDAEIDAQQRRAEQLIAELAKTLEAQGRLYREIREEHKRDRRAE